MRLIPLTDLFASPSPQGCPLRPRKMEDFPEIYIDNAILYFHLMRFVTLHKKVDDVFAAGLYPRDRIELFPWVGPGSGRLSR